MAHTEFGKNKTYYRSLDMFWLVKYNSKTKNRSQKM